MGDVLQFTPRPKRTTPEALPPLAGAELRASLEEAAQTALDAADRIIAGLDRMDGDTDHEDGGDAEPSLAAPENHEGSQVVYRRGGDQDREAETPEIVVPDVEPEAEDGNGGDVITQRAGRNAGEIRSLVKPCRQCRSTTTRECHDQPKRSVRSSRPCSRCCKRRYRRRPVRHQQHHHFWRTRGR